MVCGRFVGEGEGMWGVRKNDRWSRGFDLFVGRGLNSEVLNPPASSLRPNGLSPPVYVSCFAFANLGSQVEVEMVGGAKIGIFSPSPDDL